MYPRLGTPGLTNYNTPDYSHRGSCGLMSVNLTCNLLDTAIHAHHTYRITRTSENGGVTKGLENSNNNSATHFWSPLLHCDLVLRVLERSLGQAQARSRNGVQAHSRRAEDDSVVPKLPDVQTEIERLF